jgi:hypothetical protein
VLTKETDGPAAQLAFAVHAASVRTFETQPKSVKLKAARWSCRETPAFKMPHDAPMVVLNGTTVLWVRSMTESMRPAAPQ